MGFNFDETKLNRECCMSDFEFGNQLNICFKGEEAPSNKNPLSRWPVAGPAAAADTGPTQLGPQIEKGLNT
jgi:hypothetical protein